MTNSVPVLEDLPPLDGARVLLRADFNVPVHDGRITDFPGTFEEWEAASTERAHAARVAAEEEETLRRVKEKKQTRTHEPPKSDRNAARSAERELAAAEAEVAACESRVESIRAQLEDPARYATADGARDATRLGRELESAKAALEAAFARWERAGAAVDALG